MIADCSVVPERSDDPARVLALVERDGAAILDGRTPTEHDARAGVHAVLGVRLLALAEAAPGHDALPLHTDGAVDGDHACDYIALACARTGAFGGATVLVDAYRLLDEIDRELRTFLLTTPVDHADAGGRPVLSPLAITTAAGRLAVRKVLSVRPGPDVSDPTRIRALLNRWNRIVVEQMTHAARRFPLHPGDVAVIDNYRMLHAGTPHAGGSETWRLWAWTDRGNGVPVSMLQPDSRYAPSG